MSDHNTSAEIEVVDVPGASRYEARLSGNSTDAWAAIATYERRDDTIVFLHTIVPRALQGRGIADALARTALDDARRQQLAVVPRCPFFGAYIRRHPEYRDLVPEALRDELLTKPAEEPRHG